MAYLEIENIVKSFGETEVLKGVGFTMEKGEVVSILGSSGSGKTTFLRCLCGLERADGGSVVADGERVFPLEKGETHSLKIGLVFQDFRLFPQYNVLENVTLAMNLLSGQEIKKSGDKKRKFTEEKGKNEARAKDLLKQVGLIDKIKNYPCELSGGQQQRVAIARALALSPDILCFDEPTSALDPALTNEVLKVISDLRNERMTMIIVTHEMEFAKNVSDKIVFMADGVVEETGTPDEIFNRPKKDKTREFLSSSLTSAFTTA